MKKNILAAIGLALSTAAAYAAIPIQHWTQPSGATVYFVASPSLPMLDVRVDFDAGGRREPADKAGLAGVTAGMTSKGVAAHGNEPALDENQLGEAWADLGANLEEGASSDRMSFSLRTLTDPEMGTVGIFTAIRQREVPGFLAVRLKVEGGRISEVEHIISTRRNLSSPPTPIGEVDEYVHDPAISQATPAAERASRTALIAHANGYFDTLQKNDGEIRGTCFRDDATRRENGMLFSDIGGGFRDRLL